ncbi:MAG: cytochrome c oxidase subunit II [Melioribacteraceae bacterium]|nr:cytochrome c oxidase subunit II [Melioribacteraceae bacterium]MCF8264010.1 cytochrome c oxidase subunit II [Melioribacteraceae bacterium]MCF8412694.1 cytochrome c oxidase subunit II [Melioribacteraceae bacterium]MCF8431787.1 cytochrome c oxidase subunit II [Melioribacteraceae bacterium]
MGSGATQYVETVDSVMLYIVGISVVLLIGITAVMIYFVVKYNRKKGHKPENIHGNWLLETIWIAIPTVLVMTMFYYSYIGYKDLRNFPEDGLEVNVTARMWGWTFEYENGKQTDSLYVPVNQPVMLFLESVDVNHSFYVPAFRIKEDVIAGRVNKLHFTSDMVGDYDIACAEYCGLKHSMMYSKVKVMEVADFDKWYAETDATTDETNIETNPVDSTAAEIKPTGEM